MIHRTSATFVFTTLVRALVITVPLLFVAFSAATAAKARINKTPLGGVAIEGYDTVAYFSDSGPVKGSKEHEVEWKGATWRFANAGNRDRFVADPERYAPRYGGYCAFAVSQGLTAGIDPAVFRIVEDKLYLNYSKEIQGRWEQDIRGNIAKADANYPKLVGADE